ncbi:MAG: cyanophycinase [Pseudomonadota bacterium]
MPSPVLKPGSRGAIIPIGGAEDKLHDRSILRRFVGLCQPDTGRLVVIPTASRLRDTGERYRALFEDLGCAEVAVLDLTTRRAADRAATAEVLKGATGVFLTGGNQLRLSTILGGTKAATAIRRLNAAGVPVAGTSAGAAFISEHMIAFGGEGLIPRVGEVSLAPGLGLTNRVIVDQHFRQRGRLGRLLAALAYNPFAIGLGLDEDTAAFIGPDEKLEVVGSGGVTILDVSELEHSSMAAAEQGDAVQLVGVRLHVLARGGTYDLGKRRAKPGPVHEKG